MVATLPWMRLAVIVGIAILAAAAWVVPMPLQTSQPSRLVAAAGAVDVTIATQFATDAALRLQPVQGEFLAVHQTAGPSLSESIAAGLSPSTDLLAPRSPARHELERPEVIAAVLGLGMSPARLPGTALPVTVRVTDDVDPGSLGVALQVFDAASALDVGRGRRILGVGAMTADQRLQCTAEPGPSLAAALREQVDVVLVAAACGAVEPPSGPAVISVATLTDAVDALLAAR